ncbi:MAG: autoinducer binding domain-containing protein [Pseudomonadota bacterium]
MQHALRVVEREEHELVPNPVDAGGWHQKVEDALDAFVRLSRDYGFKSFAVVDISKRYNERLLPTIEINNLVPAFLSCLEDEGPLGDCSLFRVLEQTCRPFSWRSGFDAFTGLPNSKETETNDKEFDELLSAFGIESGFCVPVHDPRGKRSAVIYFGNDVGSSKQRENLIIDTISIFDGAKRHAFEQRTTSRAQLSDKQIDCLTLAAKGASNREIANQLKFSEHLVAAFLSSINEKFGTSTTAQSIAKALDLEIISL